MPTQTAARMRAALLVVLAAAPLVRAQTPVSGTENSAVAAREAALARGDTAGAASLPFGWFARGLAAGAVAGPLGTWWISGRADRSAVGENDAPGAMTAIDRGEMVSAYREGYVARIRSERREYAFVGSVVGTVAFLVAVLKFSTHLRDQAGSSGSPPAEGPSIDRILAGGCCAYTAVPLSRNR